MADEEVPGPELEKPPARGRTAVRVRLATVVVLAGLLIALGVDNAHDVDLEYLVGEARVRLVWVIVAAFLAGVLLTRLSGFVRGARRQR